MTFYPNSYNWTNLIQKSNKKEMKWKMTCLRQEGKVILAVEWGDLTISLVISLHLLQTQAQTTTFLRSGHLSSEDSTRAMISIRSSGKSEDHLPESTLTKSVVEEERENEAAEVGGCGGSRWDLEEEREKQRIEDVEEEERLDRKDLVRDIRLSWRRRARKNSLGRREKIV